jgi:hypothetical protein
MFHSETLARVIHADRVRDLERAANERRMLTDVEIPVAVPVQRADIRRVSEPCRPATRNGSPA